MVYTWAESSKRRLPKKRKISAFAKKQNFLEFPRNSTLVEITKMAKGHRSKSHILCSIKFIWNMEKKLCLFRGILVEQPNVYLGFYFCLCVTIFATGTSHIFRYDYKLFTQCVQTSLIRLFVQYLCGIWCVLNTAK